MTLEVIDGRLSEQDQVTEWKIEMADAIRSASPHGVVVDMKNVELLTSVALFPLIATRGVTKEVGARLVLCNLSVSQLIVESREHAQHFSMAETLEHALKMFDQ